MKADIIPSRPPEPPEHHGALPWDPSVQTRTKYVRLTNNGDIAFTDRHDGVPVRVEPGKADNFPMDMAAHFFGYYDGAAPEAMFRHVCKRQGWNTPAHLMTDESGKTLAQRLFNGLDIRAVMYKMVEEKIDTDAPIPADPQPPKYGENDLPALPRNGKPSQSRSAGAA